MSAQAADRPAVSWRLVDGLVKAHRVARGRGMRMPAAVKALPAVGLVGLLAAGLGLLFWKSIHAYDSYRGVQGALSLDQFHELFFGDNASFYLKVLLRTIVISAVTTVTSILCAIPVAYFVARTSRGWLRLAVLGIALVPFLFGEVIRAFGWYLLIGRNGAVASVASLFGDDGFTLIGTSTAVWLGSMQSMVPVAILVVLPAMRAVAPDLERAAGTLGAAPWKVWRHVVLPLLRPGIVAAAAVTFSLTMTAFAIPDLLGGGVQPFIANATQNIYFQQGNVYLGSALAVVQAVIVIVVDAAILLIGGRQPRVRREGRRRRRASVANEVSAA